MGGSGEGGACFFGAGAPSGLGAGAVTAGGFGGRAPTGRGGRVRIDGEEWTARAYDETLVIPPGKTVDVMEISGATAIVYPRD